ILLKYARQKVPFQVFQFKKLQGEINMLSFNEKLYKENAFLTYDSKEDVEKVADEISKEDISNIFFVSVGGSLAIMKPIQEIMKQITTLPVYTEQAAELLTMENKQLSSNSLIIMASKSGDTAESVEAIKHFRKHNYKVVSMIGKRGTEMEKNSDWVIHNRATNGIEFQYMLLFILVLRIVAYRSEFTEYKEFAEQLELLPNNLLNAKKQFEPIADKIASQYAKEPYSIWIGGGVLWGEVYFFTMCVLEEFLWVRTKAVSSAEFLHGTFELVVVGVTVLLIIVIGLERILDKRVIECSKMTIYIVDINHLCFDIF